MNKLRSKAQKDAEKRYDAKRGGAKLTIRFKTNGATKDLKSTAAKNGLTLSELVLKSVDIAKKAGEIK